MSPAPASARRALRPLRSCTRSARGRARRQHDRADDGDRRGDARLVVVTGLRECRNIGRRAWSASISASPASLPAPVAAAWRGRIPTPWRAALRVPGRRCGPRARRVRWPASAPMSSSHAGHGPVDPTADRAVRRARRPARRARRALGRRLVLTSRTTATRRATQTAFFPLYPLPGARAGARRRLAAARRASRVSLAAFDRRARTVLHRLAALELGEEARPPRPGCWRCSRRRFGSRPSTRSRCFSPRAVGSRSTRARRGRWAWAGVARPAGRGNAQRGALLLVPLALLWLTARAERRPRRDAALARARARAGCSPIWSTWRLAAGAAVRRRSARRTRGTASWPGPLGAAPGTGPSRPGTACASSSPARATHVYFAAAARRSVRRRGAQRRQFRVPVLCRRRGSSACFGALPLAYGA